MYNLMNTYCTNIYIYISTWKGFNIEEILKYIELHNQIYVDA